MIGSKQNVLRFNITMNDSVGMSFRQRITDIYGDADSGIDRDMRMRIDVLFQCLPFHIFHDDVVIPFTASHIINPNNVRMAQFYPQTALPAENGQ